jgi:predicted transcriptional regulator
MTPTQFKKRREQLGYTQTELSVLLGCSLRHVQRLEKGEADIDKPTWFYIMHALEPQRKDKE